MWTHLRNSLKLIAGAGMLIGLGLAGGAISAPDTAVAESADCKYERCDDTGMCESSAQASGCNTEHTLDPVECETITC